MEWSHALFGATTLAIAATLRHRSRTRIPPSPLSTRDTASLGPPESDARFKLKLVGKPDDLYERHGPKPFEFNREVVNVFDDMVSRSVPLYREVMDLLLYWAHRYYQEGTAIIDLGCSTGTTIDVVARMFRAVEDQRQIHFVGVDNSEAMIEKCREKLSWLAANMTVQLITGDILTAPLQPASLVIMNYTLQFIPVRRRAELLRRICDALCMNGILFLSEKVRSEDMETQEACTWIYEDFKARRGYSQTYIARKKDALMNVLIPYSDTEMIAALRVAGFQHVEIIAKWNSFSTFVARKGRGLPVKGMPASTLTTDYLDSFFDYSPMYLADYLSQSQLQTLCKERLAEFAGKGGISVGNLKLCDELCRELQRLPKRAAKKLVCNESVVKIGELGEYTEAEFAILEACVAKMKPWKKGPFELFGIEIDAEWRSDWKWERILPHLPSMKDKVICDLGCSNGYYMFRMLEHSPRLVVGLDPNLKAWIQFQALKRMAGVDQLRFEYLRGEHMHLFHRMFDVVFCLGVLYHTPDPIGMLRKIHDSMKGSATIIVDCQGIPGEEDVALFPQKRYANMKGVYFLPTISTLKNWMTRTRFYDIQVFFSEPLTVEEQRITEWAPVNTSLKESLDPNDTSKTMEGYPAPHRFYLKAKRG